MSAGWGSIVSLWAWMDVPADNSIEPKVKDAIESLMTGYARTISAHP